jgi:hypothetical protein
MFLCLCNWNKLGQKDYILNDLKKSADLFCWKGGGREEGKIGYKGPVFFAANVQKL